MNHSDSIAALAAALSKAQGAMQPAVKDAKNPHLDRSYADLASVWNAAREHLTANGLSVMQTFQQCDPGRVTVETILAHSSGEWVSSVLTMPAEAKGGQQGAQAYGSAITYARRYSLAAILGIAPAGDDDDGEAASQPAQQRAAPKPQTNGAALPTKAEALTALRASPGWLPAAGDHAAEVAFTNELLGRLRDAEPRFSVKDLVEAREHLLQRKSALVDVPVAGQNAQAAGR